MLFLYPLCIGEYPAGVHPALDTVTNTSAIMLPLQAHQASCVEPDSADMDVDVEIVETIPDTPPEAGVHSPTVPLPVRSYASCYLGA